MRLPRERRGLVSCRRNTQLSAEHIAETAGRVAERPCNRVHGVAFCKARCRNGQLDLSPPFGKPHAQLLLEETDSVRTLAPACSQ